MRLRLALTVLIAFLALACSEEKREAPEEEAPAQLTGVIIDVDATSLTEVQGFTLRSEGETYEILLDPQINLGFPPSHLNEHSITGDPVRVELESQDGKLYAQSIVDA